MYESLFKLHYNDPTKHKEIYQSLFNTPTTKHFNFSIREYNRREKFPAFFCYTEDFAVLTDKIYQSQETLLKSVDEVPELLMDQFILACVVDEVRATSKIEGVHSTRREIKDVITGASNSSRFSSIVAKYENLLQLRQINFQTCNDIRTFYDEFFHNEIANEIPIHALDGKLFRSDVVDITSATGKILHRGVYPESKIIESLNAALDILNAENIPILVRVSIFHYLFEYIHPFYDGNGRTARFIVSYYLASRFHRLAALRLSAVIKKKRRMYYDLFAETDSEWNKGDLTPFVIGFCEIILETFNNVLTQLNNKLKQLTKYRYELLPKLVSDDELTLKIYDALLQSSAFFGGGISMEGLIKYTGKSRNTIRSRLNSIPENHIVKIGEKKIFYKLNMMIFTKV